MNTRRLTILILQPLLFLALTGCHSRLAGNSKESEVGKVSLFQKGKGIYLPDEMRKEFGVEVVEVAEKTLPRRLTRMARVYRAAQDGQPARASLLATAEEITELKLHQPVTLQGSPGNSPSVTGLLLRVDENARQVFGQAELLVEFADVDRRFPLGAFLTATFVTREAKPVFVVPEPALLRAADGCFVYVVNGEHLTRTPVKAGIASDGLVEIEDGLYAGDSVAAKGIESLWLVELSALKGGTPCCPVPRKNTGK